LQIAGLSHGVDRWVVRGPATRSFAAFGFRDGNLAVVDSNAPARAQRHGLPYYVSDPDFGSLLSILSSVELILTRALWMSERFGTDVSRCSFSLDRRLSYK
jgi:hypothetical protein